MSDYPELDEAMLNSMVEDFESNASLEEIGVPLPPQTKKEDEPSVPVELPPEFSKIDVEAEKNLAENTIPVEIQQEIEGNKVKAQKSLVPKEEKSVNSDVENLDLLENVFDKRVTDQQVQAKIKEEQNKNDSGRLLDKKDVEVKTELNDAEILTISKLRFMSERYNLPVLNEFTNNLMTLKISRHRKGRGEFIQGLHADERRDTGVNEGFFSKLFNKGGQN